MERRVVGTSVHKSIKLCSYTYVMNDNYNCQIVTMHPVIFVFKFKSMER